MCMFVCIYVSNMCICNADIIYNTQRPKPGPVAENATPWPSSWASNARPLDY